MSTGFAFKQSLHLHSVSNLRIFLVFQLRPFKVGFSGPKTFRGFRETGHWLALSSVKYHDNLLILLTKVLVNADSFHCKNIRTQTSSETGNFCAVNF